MNKQTIMLVDDEERFLQTTKKLIEKEGFTVLTAQSGKEALQKLEEHKVYVVVLDVKMPEMDGIETLKKIKIKFPMVQVIMLTGHATVESAVEGMHSGAIDYLMKPVEIDILLHKVNDGIKTIESIEEKILEAKTKKAMHSSFNPI